MKNKTLETKNLLIKQNKITKEWECFRKVGEKLLFLTSSTFQTAVIATMRIAMDDKYRDEINEALGV